jgi:CRP-like cAMP-binding protein
LCILGDKTVALDQDIELLASVPLLAQLEREALRLIAFSADTRILNRGDVLFHKDEPADGAYLVLSGSLSLDANEEGSPSFMHIGVGHLLGETALFIRTIRPATAIALETTHVMKLQTSLMRRVLTEFPRSAKAALGFMAQRLTGTSGDIMRAKQVLTEMMDRISVR